jgi:integrase
MPLTAREVQTAKPAAKPYGIADGGGLFLWVTADGRKYWHFRFSINGKQPRISLGTSPVISLQQARERAAECRALVANGVDPRNHRRDEKQRDALVQINTFKAAAEFWYQRKDEAGRAASTLAKIRTYLDKDILPVLGEKPLQHITRGDCAQLQERIEKRDAHNVAKKVRGWLKQIFSQAIARGLCENNPASELRAIAAVGPKVKHYPHLLEPELPEFLKALDRSTSGLTGRVAAWMTLWTASRPGMVRHAEWVDIDFGRALWTVPAAKMKMRRDHVVALPKQLLAALRELHQLTGRDRYLFPGIGTKHPILFDGNSSVPVYRGASLLFLENRVANADYTNSSSRSSLKTRENRRPRNTSPKLATNFATTRPGSLHKAEAILSTYATCFTLRATAALTVCCHRHPKEGCRWRRPTARC